jgi:hypothetical protein
MIYHFAFSHESLVLRTGEIAELILNATIGFHSVPLFVDVELAMKEKVLLGIGI